MTFKVPPRPTGTSREAIYDQWVWDVLNALLRINVPGASASFSSRGLTLVLPKTSTTKTATGNMRWQGEWDHDKSYKAFDVVRVTSFDDTLVGDGNNYTGVWLCLVANSGHQPIYPEPTAGTVYWVMLSMGVRELNVADQVDGSKKQLTASNDAYTPP